MTATHTPQLFADAPKPARARPRVLMHVCDAGDVQCGAEADLGKPMCRLRCSSCSVETDWLTFETVTEAKRGIPCEACNKETT